MISLIAAIDRKNGIGLEGRLPWPNISEDMKHFRDKTIGKPVIMGRKTWDSLPPKYRPLVGRRNIVVTRNRDFVAEGATVVNSLDEALEIVKHCEEAFVIGGAEIFSQAIDKADRLYLTEITKDYECDTFFPEVTLEYWAPVSFESKRTLVADVVFIEFHRRS